MFLLQIFCDRSEIVKTSLVSSLTIGAYANPVKLDWMMMGEDKFALTPIEETKGYLGHIIEGEVDWGTPLQVLASFDWTLYGMMCDEIGADSWRKSVFCQPI